MLQLHNSFKSVPFVVFYLIIFSSCSSISKNDIEVIKALHESVESSNKMLSISSSDVMYSLKDKMNEPSSRERAQVWYPMAEQIQQLSRDVFDFIENTKHRIKDTSINSHELFEKLKSYRKEVLQVDPKITDQFQVSLKIFTTSIDSSNNDQEKLLQDYFKNASAESTIAMLSKLQNNIRINEIKMVTFCNEQGCRISFGPCETDLPLVVINSSIVQPDEKIEIIAGNGTFYTNRNTKVFINEQPIKMREDGVAEYKFRASSNSGTYYISVRVNYIDQNGKEQSVQKQIEYTVANIQKQ